MMYDILMMRQFSMAQSGNVVHFILTSDVSLVTDIFYVMLLPAIRVFKTFAILQDNVHSIENEST